MLQWLMLLVGHQHLAATNTMARQSVKINTLRSHHLYSPSQKENMCFHKVG